MIPLYFNETTYLEFLEYLYSLAETRYKEFHSRLIKDSNLIGVRTPVLKQIAKEISKHDYQGFIEYNSKKTYEEKVLYGLVLGYIKVDFETRLQLLNDFIPYIDNWAINDIVCANIKDFKKNYERGYSFIISCIRSNQPWRMRFGIVLLLDFYIHDIYIDRILELCNTIRSEDYYVKMAIAWLLSICYIKYKEKTLLFLQTTLLDDWTYNKAIQKIIESSRVSRDEKLNLRKLKK